MIHPQILRKSLFLSFSRDRLPLEFPGKREEWKAPVSRDRLSLEGQPVPILIFFMELLTHRAHSDLMNSPT